MKIYCFIISVLAIKTFPNVNNNISLIKQFERGQIGIAVNKRKLINK